MDLGFFDLSDMFGEVASEKQSAMDQGMKGLDPSIQHFRKPGDFFDPHHR